jgi:hypothetical protein
MVREPRAGARVHKFDSMSDAEGSDAERSDAERSDAERSDAER